MKTPVEALAILALSSILAACSGGSTPPSPSPAPGGNSGQPINVDAVIGQTSGASFPAGVLFLGSTNDITTVNVGTLGADGRVTLNLTEPPVDASTLTLLPPANSGCIFDGLSSGFPTISKFSRLYALSGKRDGYGTITEQFVTGATLNGSVVARIYSDGAATAKGTASCSGGNVNYDVILRAGWNAVEYAYDGHTLFLHTPSTAARTKLVAHSFEPAVNISLDMGQPLTFSTSDPVTVATRIYQDGGFSGQISLSTDLDGLSIEPSTVTLPALTGQQLRSPDTAFLSGLGLGAQRLDTPLTFRYTGQGTGNMNANVIVKDASGKQVGSSIVLINVVRPAIYVSGPRDTPDLLKGSSIPLNVGVSSINGFQGPVTITASNLPAGVSVPPVTVQLAANASASTTLTVSASASAVSGSHSFTVRATGTGVSSEFTASVYIPQPAAELAIVNRGAEVSRGQTGTLDVSAHSVYGFSGPTTITLAGLPAGVTAKPVTVQLTQGGTATAHVAVTVASTALLGSYPITASSPDATFAATGTLSVVPPSTYIGPTVTGMAASGSGVWLLTASTFDPQTGAETATVGRYVNGTRVAQATVPNSGIHRITTRSGDLLTLNDQGTGGWKIGTTGTSTAFTHPLTPLDTPIDATDAQGQVWFLRSDYSGSAPTQSLCVWPGSGTTVTCPRDFGASAFGRMVMSNDGRTLVIQSGQDSGAYRIDTATRVLTPVDVGGSSQVVRALAVRNDGSIWTRGSGGEFQLRRLDVNGSVQLVEFPALDVDSFAGFDRANPNRLWALSSSGAQLIDVSAHTQTTLPVRGLNQLQLLDGGGVVALTYNATLDSTSWALAYLP